MTTSPRGSTGGRPSLATGALLVFAGGTLGTMARYGVAHLLPPADGWPWGTFAANLTGAFVLGALLERLAQLGPESESHRRLRLFGGTGVLGGYTTYSALAVETDRLVTNSAVLLAFSYVALTLLGGLAAAAAGVWFGAGRRPRRDDGDPVDPDIAARGES